MELSTCQMAKHRKVDSTKTLFVDTTIKSGARFLAPEWEMVMGHKAGSLSDGDYTDRYLKILNRSLITNPEDWDRLLSQPSVCLACYCRAGCFCHRLLLVPFMKTLCIERGLAFKYLGEIV